MNKNLSYIAIIGVTLLSLFTTSAQSQKPSSDRQFINVRGGYKTGQDYLKEYNNMEKAAYALGLIDAMVQSELMGAPKDQPQRIEDCIKNMDGAQIAAILTKYLENHPERWHHPASVSMYTVMMYEACPK